MNLLLILINDTYYFKLKTYTITVSKALHSRKIFIQNKFTLTLEISDFNGFFILKSPAYEIMKSANASFL
jgi:hypothetical protein